VWSWACHNGVRRSPFGSAGIGLNQRHEELDLIVQRRVEVVKGEFGQAELRQLSHQFDKFVRREYLAMHVVDADQGPDASKS
jgi:hypothetical protein